MRVLVPRAAELARRRRRGHRLQHRRRGGGAARAVARRWWRRCSPTRRSRARTGSGGGAAYGRRAGAVIDWLDGAAPRLDRRIMVRLIKGAYGTARSSRRRSGAAGLPGLHPQALDRHPASIADARQLLEARDRIYPHSPRATPTRSRQCWRWPATAPGFEFQRLHGMGEALHEIVREREGTRCRSTRRSGRIATSSRTWCGGCSRTAPTRPSSTRSSTRGWRQTEIAADPIAAVEGLGDAVGNDRIRRPAELFAPRRNSKGLERQRAGVGRGPGRRA